MTSELGNTLQSLSEEIGSPGLTMERAEKLFVEIAQEWLANEGCPRIQAKLDEMTARLLAWTDGANERNAQLREAAE